MSDEPTTEINPAIGAMLSNARDMLTHEHSLFKTLDLKPVLMGRCKLSFSFRLSEEFCAADGSIEGGFMTIALDTICGLTVFTALEKIQPIATINLRTDYLAKAGPGERVVCACECEEISGDIAFVKGTVKRETDGSIIARAEAAFMVGSSRPEKGSRL